MSCFDNSAEVKISIDSEGEKSSYGKDIHVFPLDDSVEIKKHLIVISPAKEGVTYSLSGYFNGQIISSTKNTILKLDNLFLENNYGKTALSLKAKTEISTAKDSVNYIISSGQGFSKTGAIQTKKDLVLGGSGTLYVKGRICHGIEGDNIKIKGSGNIYLEGSKKGAALTCDTLTVEENKTFAAYFLNSKNGIKADKSVKIASGNFHLYNNESAIRTGLSKKGENSSHSVTLSGGSFYTCKNENFVITDENKFFSKGASIIED